MKRIHQQRVGRKERKERGESGKSEPKYRALPIVETDTEPVQAMVWREGNEQEAKAATAEMTTVNHVLEIPGGLPESFRVTGRSQLDRVQVWAEKQLSASGISQDWRYALGATDSQPATPQWYAAQALASVHSVREFIAENKARDAVSSAMFASLYFHHALILELSERVHVGDRIVNGEHFTKYSDADRAGWDVRLAILLEKETYLRSIEKTARHIAKEENRPQAFATIKKYLQDNHRDKFTAKKRTHPQR